ncbi:hypothetical protein DFH11DRAFT_1515182 [Phellopilus nigrolimitatus]|nr:hypothetical protein DFH11DRAFT_1515182 [Phellopilus nigrolimitatus]
MAGKVFDFGKNRFSETWNSDQFSGERHLNPYHPFNDERDWELAKWLQDLNVSMEKVDAFFKLKLAPRKPDISFTSCKEMREKIEKLPSPPKWKETEVSVKGGTTKKPLTLLYRDGLECFKYLFGNPLFQNHMDFIPRRVYTDDKQKERLYSEIMTGDYVWDVQDNVGAGETLGLVMLGSDKTHLTNHQGDKECHCVYISCGNILKSLRTKASGHCWLMIAQIPVAKFHEQELQGLLSNRLYHECMDIVTATMKKCSAVPERMADPSGNIRLTRLLLALVGLNGVHLPFWRDWESADPSCFLAPDALHQWHKFFVDHAVKWAKYLLGNDEIDRRMSVIQPRSGCRHFDDGFTRFKQHTGREQRDIERVFVAVLAGHKSVNVKIMRAFRGLMDFIYVAQYESHSTETLSYLRDALKQFHDNKVALSKAGVRDGKMKKGKFNIPKLELMQNVERLIKALGSVAQFSSDQTERCHIEMAKIPYRSTNRKEYASQMCRFLDRQERVRLFDWLLEWNKCQTDATADFPAGTTAAERRHSNMITSDDRHMRQSTYEHLVNIFLPATVPSYFEHKRAICNDTTAIIIPSRHSQRHLGLIAAMALYGIPDLRKELIQYFKSADFGVDRNGLRVLLPFNTMHTWWNVSVQLRHPQDEDSALPKVKVLATPPSKNLPLGRYNFVLCKESPDSKVQGHFVGQVRLLFEGVYHDLRKDSVPLAYVQVFQPARNSTSKQKDGVIAHVADDNIEMFRVERRLRSDGSRKGVIIRLDDIWRPVELIPRYGENCPENWTCDTAVELAKQFYVNCFADKTTFQEVY